MNPELIKVQDVAGKDLGLGFVYLGETHILNL